MIQNQRPRGVSIASSGTQVRGLAGRLFHWILDRLRVGARGPARLAVLEKISLAPRQSLSLVEAEGQRFLVTISTNGAAAFQALAAADRRNGRVRRWPGTSGVQSDAAGYSARRSARGAVFHDTNLRAADADVDRRVNRPSW